MSFANFTNPYRNPADVPEDYRKHPNLSKLFKTDSTYVRGAEDPVTMWAIDILHREYSVPLEMMGLELHLDFAEGTYRGGRRWQGKLDLVIFDDQLLDEFGNPDTVLIALEALAPNFAKDSPEWVEHLNRLNSYMSGSGSACYAIITNGHATDIYSRDLGYPRDLQIIGDLPKYESSREAAKHSPFTVVLNPDEPDGFETGLKPLSRDKFREVLGDTRSGCHSILRDNEGLQPQEAVDAMVKFLFAKWYDEQATVDLAKQTGESRAYAFTIRNEANHRTDPERLTIQVRETFQKAKEWERKTLSKKFGEDLNIRLAFTGQDELFYKAHTTWKIVEKLQPWSLRRSTADVKGGVFEDFLGKTFRDDLGQYFTPTPVINLMVGILQPTVHDFVGDPACGSARMLTHVLDYVRKRELARAEAEGFEVTNLDEPTPEFIEFRDNALKQSN
ncbi:MAG: hypothetical protein Kow00121_46370 [Elainellaceae cyanobacterium]